MKGTKWKRGKKIVKWEDKETDEVGVRKGSERKLSKTVTR